MVSLRTPQLQNALAAASEHLDAAVVAAEAERRASVQLHDSLAFIAALGSPCLSPQSSGAPSPLKARNPSPGAHSEASGDGSTFALRPSGFGKTPAARRNAPMCTTSAASAPTSSVPDESWGAVDVKLWLRDHGAVFDADDDHDTLVQQAQRHAALRADDATPTPQTLRRAMKLTPEVADPSKSTAGALDAALREDNAKRIAAPPAARHSDFLQKLDLLEHQLQRRPVTKPNVRQRRPSFAERNAESVSKWAQFRAVRRNSAPSLMQLAAAAAPAAAPAAASSGGGHRRSSWSVGDASAVQAIEKAATRHVSAQLVALAAANAGFK